MVKDFDQCMECSTDYVNSTATDKWAPLKGSYCRYLNESGVNLIPKNIHQIWLGSPLPQALHKLTQTIQETNPGFTYRLWTDADVATLEFNNRELLYKTPNNGQRSDILRYAILEQFGGIYLDTDFTGYKSFESLLHLNFFAGVAYGHSEPVLYNGLIGTVPRHPIIRALNEIKNVGYSDGMAVIRSTGPYFFTEKFLANFSELDRVVALPITYFYPFPNFPRDRKYGEDKSKYIQQETICLHEWHSLWN
jgi:mannosyltransferase OCH1-like enzyme